jgi:hypothetical protein
MASDLPNYHLSCRTCRLLRASSTAGNEVSLQSLIGSLSVGVFGSLAKFGSSEGLGEGPWCHSGGSSRGRYGCPLLGFGQVSVNPGTLEKGCNAVGATAAKGRSSPGFRVRKGCRSGQRRRGLAGFALAPRVAPGTLRSSTGLRRLRRAAPASRRRRVVRSQLRLGARCCARAMRTV